MTKHAFISYLREDQKLIERFCQELEKHGILIWLDKKNIQPGHKWKIAIHNAIRNGDFFIACFSESYSNRSKNWMKRELYWAVEKLKQHSDSRTWFIPVILDESNLPDYIGDKYLHDIQFIRLHNDWKKGIDSLVNVINPIPRDIQNLIESLDSSSLRIRIEAIKELSIKKDLRSIQPLISLLDDISVRDDAARALGQFGDISAISALADRLITTDPVFRSVIENALKSQQAITSQHLSYLLRSDNAQLSIRAYILLKKLRVKVVISKNHEYIIKESAKQLIYDAGIEIGRLKEEIADTDYSPDDVEDGRLEDDYFDLEEKKKEYRSMVRAFNYKNKEKYDPFPEYNRPNDPEQNDLYIYPKNTNPSCHHTWEVWDGNFMCCTTCGLGR